MVTLPSALGLGPELKQPDFRQLSDSAWNARSRHKDLPATLQQAFQSVESAVHTATLSLETGREVEAQRLLEDGLFHMLIAMRMLTIDPARGLERALLRYEQAQSLAHHGEEREFVLYPNWVDIRVGQEIRGGWPLLSLEDHQAIKRLAEELGCRWVEAPAQQLALF